MAIKIKEDEPDIELTRYEYDKLYDEYDAFLLLYSGPKLSFEAWLRRKRSQQLLQEQNNA